MVSIFKGKSAWKVYGGVLFLFVFLFLAYIGIEYFRALEPEVVRAHIVSAGIWAPIVFIFLYAVGTVFLIPGTPLTLLGGALFGLYAGVTYVVIGATLGATIVFLGARFLGRDAVERFFSASFPRVLEYDERLKTHGFITVLFFRLVPLFPFNVLNVVLGFSRVSARSYITATFLGIIPGTAAYAYFGDSLFMLSLKNIACAIGILVLFSVFGFLAKRFFHQKEEV